MKRSNAVLFVAVAVMALPSRGDVKIIYKEDFENYHAGKDNFASLNPSWTVTGGDGGPGASVIHELPFGQFVAGNAYRTTGQLFQNIVIDVEGNVSAADLAAAGPNPKLFQQYSFRLSGDSPASHHGQNWYMGGLDVGSFSHGRTLAIDIDNSASTAFCSEFGTAMTIRFSVTSVIQRASGTLSRVITK